MSTPRREFLERLATGAVFAAGLGALDPETTHAQAAQTTEWDTRWPDRIKGKHRAVFDAPEMEAGFGVLRAVIWRRQYMAALGVDGSDLTAVAVIRHSAIPLAMSQAFWDRYQLGKKLKIKDEETNKITNLNPVLTSDDQLPPAWKGLNLDGFFATGGIALACDLALGSLISIVAKEDKLERPAARARVVEHLYPGVILQPSGVFAVIRAQEAGCHYIRSS